MLICLTTALINLTAIQFNDQDLKALSRAQLTCKQDSRYNGCVKSLTKREQGIYRVECGKKQEFDRKAFDKAELDVILEELSHLSLEDKKKALRKIGVEVK